MKLLRVYALLAAAASAQEFEVASVKSSSWFDGECPQSMKLDRGRMVIECATIRTLIGNAYRFSPERIKGPEWMAGPVLPRFDIVAKIPQGAPLDRVPEMLQALLASRFQLVLHRGAIRQEIYALVVAKGGPKLTPAASPAAGTEIDADSGDFFGDVQMRPVQNATMIRNPRMGAVLESEGRNRSQQWHAPSISMPGLADLLDKVAPLPAPIIDMTSLPGRYQLILEVNLNERRSPEEMEAQILAAFNDGLRKLGLQLEHRTGPIESLIIDRIEKTPTGN